MCVGRRSYSDKLGLENVGLKTNNKGQLEVNQKTLCSVGKTEQELKEAGIPFNKGQFPFVANGRAKSLGNTDGFVKVLAHKETDKILGVHILGPRAGDLIAEAVVAMEFHASSEDVARSFHAHPTLSEVIREACLGVQNRTRQM